MTNFETLYNHVMLVEKGYNPNDQGAETYSGIWRNAFPNWAGWKTIDAIKKTRTIKRAEYLSQIEPLVKDFYKEFWKPCKVDSLKETKLAQLIVDMRTQHGSWARIIYAGLANVSPLKGNGPDTALPNSFTDAMVKQINADSVKAYQNIAKARLTYSTGIRLQNEGDRKGIIARAKKYVTDAASFLKANPAASATGIIVFAVFFF